MQQRRTIVATVGAVLVAVSPAVATGQPAAAGTADTAGAITARPWADIDPGSNESEAQAVAVDPVRNVVHVAETDDPVAADNNRRFRTVSYELRTGIVLRTKTYDDPEPVSDRSWYDGPRDIAVDPSTGAYYVTGVVATPDGGALTRTLAYTKLGRPMWTDRYEGAVGTSVVVDAARSTVYVLSAAEPAPGQERYFAYHVLAFDADTGARRWTATRYEQAATVFGAPGDLAVDAVSGTVVVTGELNNGTTAATVAWSADGRFRWEARERGERAVALASGDGSVAVVGSKDGVYYTRSFALDSGELRWQARTRSETGAYGEAADIAVDPASGAVYVTGFTVLKARDFLTLALDDTGRQRWLRTYDGPAERAFHDGGVGVLVDPIRQVVHVVGRIGTDLEPNDFDSFSDLGLLSYTAADGRLLRVGQFSAGEETYLRAVDVDLDPESGIIVALGSVAYIDEAAVTVAFGPVSGT